MSKATAEQTALAVTEENEPGLMQRDTETGVVTSVVDYQALIARAIDKGLEGVEALERIAAMMERQAAEEARRAFDRALSAFQAEVGPIPRTGQITVSGTVRSTWAKLDVIAETIREPLAKHGLAYSFDSVEDADWLTTLCIVRHVGGHRETSTVRLPRQGGEAPKMNAAQVAGSTHSYGMRYALVQALGLTSVDPDDDARWGPVEPEKPITDAQIDALMRLVDEAKLSSSRLNKLLALLGVESFSELPASHYETAVRHLEAAKG